MANQPTKLSRDIYGQADKYIDQLKEKYHLTERQIQAIVSRSLANEDNWSTPASGSDRRQVVQELEHLYKNANQSDRQLIAVSMANRSLHSVADVTVALVSIELIHLASWRKQQLTEALHSIPQKVWDNGFEKAKKQAMEHFLRKWGRKPTPIEHQIALTNHLSKFNKGRGLKPYSRKLTQKVIAKIVEENGSGVDGYAAINRDTVQMMNTLKDTVDAAIQRHANIQDFSRDFAKKFYGTDDISGGDLYRAERLLRTEYTYTYTEARRQDMLQRGVMYYTNMAVGNRNTCKHCYDIDGTSFPVKDMEAGTNAPPFHPNCQCEIVETPPSQVEGGSLFDKNNDLIDDDVDYTQYGRHYVKSMTASRDWPLRLSGKQQNHLEHTHLTTKDPNIKKRSYLYDREDPVALLKKYSGHGTLKMNKNKWGNTEIIRANHYIGVDLPSGKPTKFAKIHYGKRGAHIVPVLRGGRGE